MGISPYAYCLNQPIIATDEEGEFVNFIVGAVVGAAMDYTTQVVVNCIKNGEISKDAFTDVDFKSIG